MTCGVAGCDNKAVYRTLGEDQIALLCLTHMEVALDKGWPAERLISLPRKAS